MGVPVIGFGGTWNVRDWFREDIRHDSPEHVVLWEAWFTQHGIDPSEVLLTEWVERRAHEGQNQIVWLEAGTRDGEPIHVHKEINLPEPPAPFPVQ
ncbi:MAG: hypothetical protein JWO67_4858 [Streptosporangiaceae bacterium]|nr:hypothetical protein [Streptosporangiaceae bacterium]